MRFNMKLENQYITKLDKKEEYKRLYEHALNQYDNIYQITHIDSGIVCTLHGETPLYVLYKLKYTMNTSTIIEKTFNPNTIF